MKPFKGFFDLPKTIKNVIRLRLLTGLSNWSSFHGLCLSRNDSVSDESAVRVEVRVKLRLRIKAVESNDTLGVTAALIVNMSFGARLEK